MQRQNKEEVEEMFKCFVLSFICRWFYIHIYSSDEGQQFFYLKKCKIRKGIHQGKCCVNIWWE